MKIWKSNSLTDAQKRQIQALQAQVNAYDKLQNEAFLSNEINFDCTAPCFYLALEGEDVVAFLTTFMPVNTETEITAFTHPQHRRKGCFSTLLAAALADAAALHIPTALFVVESSSKSGMAALQHCTPYTYARSEYRFACTRYAAAWQNSLAWQTVTAENVQDYKRVMVSCFPDLVHDVQFTQSLITEPARSGYIGYNGALPVAAYALHNEGKHCFLYGVAVEATQHNKGYGKQLLSVAVPKALAQHGKVVLDVDSSNPAALHLYRTAGFENIFQADYYSYAISNKA